MAIVYSLRNLASPYRPRGPGTSYPIHQQQGKQEDICLAFNQASTYVFWHVTSKPRQAFTTDADSHLIRVNTTAWRQEIWFLDHDTGLFHQFGILPFSRQKQISEWIGVLFHLTALSFYVWFTSYIAINNFHYCTHDQSTQFSQGCKEIIILLYSGSCFTVQ